MLPSVSAAQSTAATQAFKSYSELTSDQAAGKRVFQAFEEAKKTAPTEAQFSGGSTGKIIGAYKLLGGVALAGGSAALFLGTPVSIALGVSTAFTALQMLIASRLSKGKSEFSRKMLDLSSRIMKTNPQEPGGRERAVVPIWTVVTGAVGFLETAVNYLLRRKTQNADILNTLQKKAATPSSFQKLHQMQLQGFQWKEKLAQRLKASPVLKKAGQGAQRLPGVQWATRWKIPLYFAAVTVGSAVAGYLQSMLAVQIEKKMRPSAEAKANSPEDAKTPSLATHA